MKGIRLVKLRLLVLLGVLVLSANFCGCGAVSYILHKFAPASKGKWVPAETEALSEGKKVLILVYADEAIQYQHDQLARYRTAAHVAVELQSKLKVEVIDPSRVEGFQGSHLDWTNSHPSQIGREQFGADLVLYIELQEFTTAAEESGELLRGRLEGNCSLYSTDVASGRSELWHGKVKAIYPPDIPQVAEIGAAERIRDQTLKLFAEGLVRHFYGHHEPY